jgi:hypothetical protein
MIRGSWSRFFVREERELRNDLVQLQLQRGVEEPYVASCSAVTSTVQAKTWEHIKIGSVAYVCFGLGRKAPLLINPNPARPRAGL